jgi:hypothetical protein
VGSAQPTQAAAPSREASGVVDRRTGLDRRALSEDGAGPFRATDFDRRRGAGRRLSDNLRAAEEGELTKEQFLFLMAVEAFKKGNSKQFPSWTDVLEVVRLLGYRKTMPMGIRLTSAEDWQEPHNAPAGVRAPRWAEHRGRDDARDAA